MKNILSPFGEHISQFIEKPHTLITASHYQHKLQNNWVDVLSFDIDKFRTDIQVNVLQKTEIITFSKWIYEIYQYFHKTNNCYVLCYCTFLGVKLGSIYPNKDDVVPNEIYEIEINNSNEISLLRRHGSF